MKCKTISKFLISFFILIAKYGNSQEIDYPLDPITNKIAYWGEEIVSVTKERLFKRAEQFVIAQNFNRLENITCKDRSSVEIQIVSEPITFTDPEDGVIIGNGFFNYSYRGKKWFVATFNYRIKVIENKYSYKLYNFKILEFNSAPKNKAVVKGHGKIKEGVIYDSYSGKASGFTEFSAGNVKKFDLEEFINKVSIQKATYEFSNNLNNFANVLGATLKGEF